MIPGLVDIHFHGCMGADMCDGTKEALDIITRYEASIGVTSVCPATMTIAKGRALNVMKNAGDYAYNGGCTPGRYQYGKGTIYQCFQKRCPGRRKYPAL